MDVYRLEDELYKGFDVKREIRQQNIVNQLKNIYFTCEKKCFDFGKVDVNDVEKRCMNNCSEMMIKQVLPMTKELYFK